MRSFLQSTDTRAELISFTGIRSTEYEFTRSVLRISLSCRLRSAQLPASSLNRTDCQFSVHQNTSFLYAAQSNVAV